MDSRLISFVVPVYNEADSIEQLVEEIRQVVDRNKLRIQIVFVDDGSTDRSWDKICALAEQDR
ncbi:MAG: glycosyltransferase, partial [Phycisphaerales bacterium]|nr:glycosyltransferase [Phycisphaerales bacterium]